MRSVPASIDQVRETNQGRNERLHVERFRASVARREHAGMRAGNESVRALLVERRGGERDVFEELDIDPAGAEENERPHFRIARCA